MRFVLGCLTGLMLLSLGAGAEPLFQGRVRLASGEAAAGVQVMLFDWTRLGRPARTTTDETGYFSLPLAALDQGATLPARIQLGQNYPNPFNPSTIIPYQLPAPARVRLDVFNILGQRLATLVDEERPAGFHTATWAGTDGSGRAVSAGVYLYRLAGGEVRLTRSMVLLDGAVSEGVGYAAPAALDPSDVAAARVYGLTVSGPGLVPYVDPGFQVEAGGAAVDIAVEALGSVPRGKVTVGGGGLLGDVDNNGVVDRTDALLVLLYSLMPSVILPNDGDISLGDVNRDGQVDLADAELIEAYSADPSDPALPAGIGALVGTGTGTLKLYWTDAGTDKIQRANLDGSQIEDVINSGLVTPRGLAVDEAGGKLYWTDYGTDKIQRANLDGTAIEDLVTGLHTPLGLALDAVAGKLYWTDAGTDRIQRANLDGSDIEDLVTGLQSPLSLALDVAGGKLYWTDSGADKIQRANLDGTAIEDLVTTGLQIPRGLALDVAGGKLYWTDSGADRIQRANLDGSHIEDLVTHRPAHPPGAGPRRGGRQVVLGRQRHRPHPAVQPRR